MISLNHVSLSIEDKRILDDVSIHIERQKAAIILGPSGAGKSSILRVVLGLWKPQSGTVVVDGRDITGLTENRMLPLRRKMGMVFQGNALFDSLTVSENIAYFLSDKNELSPAELKDRVEETLDFVNLHGTSDLYPAQLSGGMKKRVAIARALAFEPEILLFDEPTTGLDPINAKSVVEMINKVKENGTTTITVTHILQDAIILGDRLTLMNEGRIVVSDSVEHLVRSDDPFIREFFFEIHQELKICKEKQLI